MAALSPADLDRLFVAWLEKTHHSPGALSRAKNARLPPAQVAMVREAYRAGADVGVHAARAEISSLKALADKLEGDRHKAVTDAIKREFELETKLVKLRARLDRALAALPSPPVDAVG